MKKLLFSKNLRFLRKKHGINQQTMADYVGKGQTTIGNWENGNTEPSLQEILQISSYFKLSVDDILYTDLEQESQGDTSVESALGSTIATGGGILTKVFQNNDLFVLEHEVNAFLVTPGILFKDAKYTVFGGSHFAMIFYENSLVK